MKFGLDFIIFSLGLDRLSICIFDFHGKLSEHKQQEIFSVFRVLVNAYDVDFEVGLFGFYITKWRGGGFEFYTPIDSIRDLIEESKLKGDTKAD